MLHTEAKLISTRIYLVDKNAPLHKTLYVDLSLSVLIYYTIE